MNGRRKQYQLKRPSLPPPLGAMPFTLKNAACGGAEKRANPYATDSASPAKKAATKAPPKADHKAVHKSPTDSPPRKQARVEVEDLLCSQSSAFFDLSQVSPGGFLSSQVSIPSPYLAIDASGTTPSPNNDSSVQPLSPIIVDPTFGCNPITQQRFECATLVTNNCRSRGR